MTKDIDIRKQLVAVRTYKEVGEIMNLHRTQVIRIEKKALDAVKKRMLNLFNYESI